MHRQHIPEHPKVATGKTATTRATSPGAGRAASLLGLQATAGNRAVGRLVQREVIPEVRDANAKVGDSQMKQVMAMIPEFMGMAVQVQGLAATQVPGGPPQALGLSTALHARLMSAGAMLDAGIRLYRKGGGRLKDIEHLLMARGHLSSAAFFAQMSGTVPTMATNLMSAVQRALTESSEFTVAEAIQKVKALTQEAGPITQAESIRQQVEDQVLEIRYLMPFGVSPVA